MNLEKFCSKQKLCLENDFLYKYKINQNPGSIIIIVVNTLACQFQDKIDFLFNRLNTQNMIRRKHSILWKRNKATLGRA